VQENLVHGDIVSAEMLGSLDQLDGGKEAAHSVHYRFGVSIHHHSLNFRNCKKCFDDVMEKGFARERTIIFARHALAVVTHGDKGS
jgi:hypothetical protein